MLLISPALHFQHLIWGAFGLLRQVLNWIQAVGKQSATLLWCSKVYLELIKVTSSINGGDGVCRLCMVGYPQPAVRQFYARLDQMIPSSLKTNV